MDLRSLGHRAPALWLLLPFAVGLAAGHGGISPAPGWSLGLAALAMATAILVPPLWVPGFLASVALTGCAYY